MSPVSKDCNQPLGLQNKTIPDSAIAASSTSGKKSEPFMVRLSTNLSASNFICWRAGHNNKQQWLRVDLGKVRKVTSVATQGNLRAGEWVTKFSIEYGYDDQHWTAYRENETKKVGMMFFLCYVTLNVI